jgi:hypothetical protein
MPKLDERGVNGGDVRCRLLPAEHAAGRIRACAWRVRFREVLHTFRPGCGWSRTSELSPEAVNKIATG